ncbi:hypothetical protein FACS1894125_6580 [Actinomycetota bacterium]|nr:hypothetical protein FACS1894125_6580 [Actinomycetota bacterium]
MDFDDAFEFERRFFSRQLPVEVFDFPANLIIQNYYLSQDGYAIRIRVQSMSTKIKMRKSTDALEVLENYYDKFDMAILTIKGPAAGGTRYESEMPIDPVVAKEMIKRGGKTIIKNRYSYWYGSDGWIIDEFGGNNHDLIIAECERTSPVVDLEIPKFCLLEVTDDKRFSNDRLVINSYNSFKVEFEKELQQKVDLNCDMFSTAFGTNVLG